MNSSRANQIERLQNRVDAALREGRGRRTLEPLLCRLLDLTEQGSDAACFARRHLAELLVESHPWRAALHLRSLLSCRPDDAVAHALMGLCQALLGNFNVAVGSYRRAMQHSPPNPWYLHNAGHLLDIALDRPAQALSMLREAHRLEPREPEITSSLAHCLVRLGRQQEASDLIKALPEAGEEKARPLGGRAVAQAAGVPDILQREMKAKGFTEAECRCALLLWQDFCGQQPPRILKPAPYAAAVEYSYSRINRMAGLSCRSLAQRYGVSGEAVQARYRTLRDRLQLKVGDARYTLRQGNPSKRHTRSETL